jgi:hypothetical protein
VSSIGEAGFPPALAAHAAIATAYFWILLLLSVVTFPVLVFMCLFFPPSRRFGRYFALHALIFAFAIMLMQFAPEPYLYWWRD